MQFLERKTPFLLNAFNRLFKRVLKHIGSCHKKDSFVSLVTYLNNKNNVWYTLMFVIPCKQALHFESLAKPAARERGSEWQSSEARGTPLFRAFASPFAFRLLSRFHFSHLTLTLP